MFLFVGSKPLAASGSKRIFQFMMLGMSFVYLFNTITNSIQAKMALTLVFDIPRKSLVRFTTLGLRKHNTSLNMTSVSEFGLIKQGACKIALKNNNVSYSSGTFTLELDENISMAGYYFKTSAYPDDFDPVNWIVEVLDSNGSWLTIGASYWTFEFYRGVLFDWKIPYQTTTERNSEVKVYYAKESLRIADCIISANYVFCYIRIFYCGITRSLDGIRTISIISLSAHVIILAIFVSLSVAANDYFQACVTSMYCLQPAVFVVGIVLFERHVLMVIYCYLSSVVLSSIGVNWLRGTPLYTPAESPSGIFRTGVLPGLLGLALVIHTLRQRVLWRARYLITQDQRQYDIIWDRLMSDADSATDVCDLKQLADGIAAGCKGLIPQHLTIRNIPENHSNSLSGFQVILESYGQQNTTSCGDDVQDRLPVTSLDQIFCQASVLHPILLDKIREWAMQSDGLFPLRCASGLSPIYVCYSKAIRRPTTLERIAWAKIKSVDRAIEKVVRSYSQVILAQAAATCPFKTLTIVFFRMSRFWLICVGSRSLLKV